MFLAASGALLIWACPGQLTEAARRHAVVHEAVQPREDVELAVGMFSPDTAHALGNTILPVRFQRKLAPGRPLE